MKTVQLSNDLVIITGEEYCRPDYLDPLTSLFKKLGFNYVRSHSKVCEYISATGNITRKRPRNNGIYIIDDHAKPSVIKTTNWVTLDSIEGVTPSSSTMHGAFGSWENSKSTVMDSDSHLNIVYHADCDQYVQVGYYNVERNNLYLSDLTHNIYGVNLIKKILETIEVFNKKHKIEREFIGLKYNEPTPTMPKKLTVGTDPEFLVLDEGNNIFSAHQLLGSDTEALIGTDGHQSGYKEIGELRPNYGEDPIELTKNVRELYEMLSVVLKIKRRKLKIYTGGGGDLGFSLGGHIHLGLPMHTNLTIMLDDFIGIPLQKLKGATRVRRRDYGRLSDVKRKPYGFEYRTPPSFIGKPDLFEGVVVVAYCLAKTWIDVVNNESSFKYNDIPEAEDYRKLSYYNMYADQIESFISYITENKSIEEYDTLAAWGITTPFKSNSIILDKDINVIDGDGRHEHTAVSSPSDMPSFNYRNGINGQDVSRGQGIRRGFSSELSMSYEAMIRTRNNVMNAPERSDGNSNITVDHADCECTSEDE